MPKSRRTTRTVSPRRLRSVGAGQGSIGEFGTARAAEQRTFGYLGLSVRLNPTLSELSFVDFMERANTIDAKSPEAVTIVKDLVREFVHPDEFERFWAHARANRQGTDDLLQLTWDLTQAAVGRPTGRRRDSSTGQERTDATSTASSSDPVLDHLAGRPDLQLLVERTRRDRRAA